jgi:glutathione S-transferase
MADLEIVGGPRSNYVWSVRIACEEKGIGYKNTAVMPHTPEANACGPTGKIPGMKHGKVALCESKAIISYLDKAFKGKKLIPSKPEQMAAVEQWCSIVNTTFDTKAFRPYIRAYFFSSNPDKSPDKAAIAAALPDMEKTFDMFEKHLAENRWLANNRFSAADILLAPMLSYLSQMPESGKLLKKRKKLNSYAKRLAKRPSVAKTTPPPRA